MESHDPKAFWTLLDKIKQFDNVNELPNAENISVEEWMNHLKNISKKRDKHEDHNLAEQIKTLENQIPSEQFKILNNAITISELKRIIKKLKNNKSPGEDMILNEMLKCGSSVLLPALTKLFNLILSTSHFPYKWNESTISLLHKKGSFYDTNNYRGISITSCLSKCFTALMAERLLDCLEENKLLHFSQAAYRKKSRTADHIFTLKSIINNYCIKKRKKLYCCFIDFKKAFDSVWREAMLFKLLSLGMGGKFYFLLKNMYLHTQSRVKFSQGMSPHFYSELGIKQGDCLSPILFNIFINDMQEIFTNNCDPVQVNKLKLNHLLFADDLVILSETNQGLQNSLDKLHQYTEKWILDINIDKTKTLTFQRYGKRITNMFHIGNVDIEQVNKYTYLGITFDSSGCFTSVETELKAKAIKATFKLSSALNSGLNASYGLHTKLFDSLIRPIATYGCEVWFPMKYNKIFSDISGDFMKRIDKIPCEALHNAFCKRLLSVYKSTSNTLSKSELGRLPLSLYTITQTIKYWNHILGKSPDSLLYQSYLSEREISSDWILFIKNILTICNLEHNWNSQTQIFARDIQHIKLKLRNIFLQKYSESKIPSHLQNSCKTQFNINITTLHPPTYISLKIPLIYKKSLTRIRLQSNRLGIITGRYTRPITPLQIRVCLVCNELDDENHLFWNCKLTEKIRADFLNVLTMLFSDFMSMNNDEKSYFILHPKSEKEALLCGKFVNNMACERNLL